MPIQTTKIEFKAKRIVFGINGGWEEREEVVSANSDWHRRDRPARRCEFRIFAFGFGHRTSATRARVAARRFFRGWRIYKASGVVNGESFCAWQAKYRWPGSTTHLFGPAERDHDGDF